MAGKNEYNRGYTYPEILIVIVIIAIVFFITIPLYKQFTALNQLKTTSQALRDQIRTAQNKATTGVSSDAGTPAHWVIQIGATANQYSVGACPVVTDTTVAGYADRYNFNSCPGRSAYAQFAFPDTFSISHQYDGYSQVNIFFSSITGNVTVYDMNGNYLGDTIDIKVSSDEYTDNYVLLHVNESGNISEERKAD